MNLKRIHLIIIAIATIVFSIAIVLIIILSSPKQKKSTPFEAIPDNASIIIDVKSPENFIANLNNNKIYKNLSKIIDINYQNSLLHYVDTINRNLNNIKIFNDNPIIMTVFKGIDKNEQFLVTNIPTEIKDDKFQTELEKNLQLIGKFEKKKIEKTEIIELIDTTHNKKTYFYIKNNLLLICNSEETVNLTLKTIIGKNQSIAGNQYFSKIKSSAGKKEIANVFINFRRIFNNTDNNNYSILNLFKNYIGWIEYDFSFDSDKLNFNGIIFNYESKKNIFNFIKNQRLCETKAANLLPSTTAFFLNIAINDAATLLEDNFLEKNSIIIEKNPFTASNINLEKEFYSLIFSEITFAITDINSEEFWDNFFIISDVNSTTIANQKIREIIEKFCKYYNLNINNYFDNIKIDSKTELPCFILPVDNFSEICFGKILTNCKAKYVCSINNFLIIGNSKTALKNFIYDVMLNNTLANNEEYKKLQENFSAKSNIFLYYSFLKGNNYLSNYLTKKNLYEDIKNKKDIFQLGQFGYQINNSSNFLYNSWSFQVETIKTDPIQPQWISKLDATMISKPAILTNHYDNSKELLVQDKKYNIYLLSDNGRIIWKIPIKEAITSKIFQIDYYNNGRLQYLFSTATKIYLLDRLGNNVEKYPIELRSKATAPMALFNYDNKRNYRLIIPCEDKKIYLYNLEGQIIKDWEFQKSENTITKELQHFRINSEDFIVANDSYKLYLLARKGKEKINFVSNFKFSNNIVEYAVINNNPCFIATDTKGTIRRFFPTINKQDTVFLGLFSESHRFALYDINADNKKEYIFTDNNKLFVYNQNKNLLFNYEFEDIISENTAFYDFGAGRIYIGIVSKEKIYLIDKNGKILENFPLIGNTNFSITNLNNNQKSYNLIVGGGNNSVFNYPLKLK